MVRRISLALSVTGKPHCAPLLPSIGIFQIFQISGHDNLTQTETISPFRFVITSDCLIVCVPQDASTYDFPPKNLELHFGCHTCRLSYFTSVSLWFRLTDRLGQVTTVTTKFSYPRCSGASERAPLILVISRKETYAIIKSNQNVSIKQRSQTLSTFFFFSSQLHYARRDTM